MDPIFPTHYRAHGKLMFTGEYAVLDGALALALPTRFGQELEVIYPPQAQEGWLSWQSYDANGDCWFDAIYLLPDATYEEGLDDVAGHKLEALLHAVQRQRPHVWSNMKGAAVTTRLDFPRQWGLGTSSTLIANMANWLQVDAYKLLHDTFGGSGYDLACANANGPILYQLIGGIPHHVEFPYLPAYRHQLYFVYLGKKQSSQDAIRHYLEGGERVTPLITAISAITAQWLAARTLAELADCIRRHENMLADILHLPRAKTLYFSDFWGEIKSLGAWGGDFVLVTSERPLEETRAYFNDKGYDVVLTYDDMMGTPPGL